MEAISAFLIYFCQLFGLTLGVFVVCGLTAWLSEKLFIRLAGTSKIVYVSSVVGTPIHELGHALMCILFAHKITDMKLLLPPGHPSGTLGYVSHSFNPKNPWARLGNLFIGIGPIFSGLGVMVLMLFLCFPTQWGAYVAASGALTAGTPSLAEIVKNVFSLLFSMPQAFAENWWRALLGLLVILAVSQHITLSGADVKGAMSAIPLYLLLLAVFAGITAMFGIQQVILQGLWLFNLRILSLFSLVIAFSLVWILLALIVFLLRTAKKWF